MGKDGIGFSSSQASGMAASSIPPSLNQTEQGTRK